MNALDVKKTDSAILSQDQKEIVFENMSDGIMMINEEGIITYCNSPVKKSSGTKRLTQSTVFAISFYQTAKTVLSINILKRSWIKGS